MPTSSQSRPPLPANPPPPLAGSLLASSAASSPPSGPPSGPPPVAPSVADGRYEFVDALRGIAALLVAVQHAAEILGWPQLHLFGHAILINLGETGVVLFFLVSGLVIPPSIARHASLRRFWIRRLCRLFPAYWASLAGCLLLGAAGLFPPPFLAMRHPALGAVVNLTMLQSFVGVPSAIGVYWTLPLELLFYTLCSALFAAGVLRRPARCLAAGIAALFAAEIAAALRHTSVPAGRLGLLLFALFGAVVLRWLAGELSRRALAFAAATLGAVVALGLWLRFSRFPVPHEIAAPTATTVLISWLLALALFWALVSIRSHRLPSPLLALGRISYSVYLWHVLILVLLQTEARRHNLPTWVVAPAVVAGTWIVSDLSYRFAERPGMRLGSRLTS